MSSHNGPFGPFSWYFISSVVRRLISACTSVLGHLEELAPGLTKMLSPPLSNFVDDDGGGSGSGGGGGVAVVGLGCFCVTFD